MSLFARLFGKPETNALALTDPEAIRLFGLTPTESSIHFSGNSALRVATVEVYRRKQGLHKTSRPHGPKGFRLTNATGYMFEFIRPLSRPFNRSMPGAASSEAGDVTAVPLDGLQ